MRSPHDFGPGGMTWNSGGSQISGWLASSHGVHVGFKVFFFLRIPNFVVGWLRLMGSMWVLSVFVSFLWLVGFVSWGPCGF